MSAQHAIGEVTGENIDEAVLTEIFSRFCIGK
jgi:tRNA U34 5-carboxymethylaminomethyl modifying GTPase MnmE/TrmE